MNFERSENSESSSRFLYKQQFHKQHHDEIGKKAKQHPEAELLLFEI